MEKDYNNIKSRGLPGGPNEVFSYVTGVFSTDGYRSDSQDVNNPFNVIPSGNITMKERDGRPLKKGPLLGVDNLGNRKIMHPGQDYQFPGSQVTEIPMAQYGIENKYSLPKRNGVRLNYNDKGEVISESSHIMATETDGKGNWFSFPTLFQNEDGTWLDMSEGEGWESAYEEAKKRGEVIEFGTDKDAAIKFGEGSWKPKMQQGGPINKWGFLNSGKEQREYVVGSGLNFPTGTGINAIGVIPKNSNPVFKGVGSFGVTQKLGNDFNIGTKVDIPFLNDNKRNKAFPSLRAEWKKNLGDFNLKANLDFPLKDPSYKGVKGEGSIIYNIPANKKKKTPILFADGGIPKAQTGLATPTAQDSLTLYYNALAKNAFYKDNPAYSKIAEGTTNADIPGLIRLHERDADQHNKGAKSEYERYLRDKSQGALAIDSPPKGSIDPRFTRQGNLYSFGDILHGNPNAIYNTESPPIYLHPNIKPQGWESYASTYDLTDIPNYEPPLIWPKSLGPEGSVREDYFDKSSRTTTDPKRSVSDNLTAMGMDNSFENRKKLYIEEAGLGDTYGGTKEENVALNNWITEGGLEQPAAVAEEVVEPVTPVNTNTNTDTTPVTDPLVTPNERIIPYAEWRANKDALKQKQNGGVPKAQTGEETKTYKDVNKLLTYKNNPDWFDSRAVYHDIPAYDNLIRQRIYSGNYGYDPSNQSIHPLAPKDRVVVSDEVNNIRAKEKKTIAQRDRVNAMSPEAQEADRKRKIAFQLAKEGKTPMKIDKIGSGSNPLLREEDKTGSRRWEGKEGQTLFLTPEEIKAYNKDYVAKSNVAMGENPLFYAPGIIAGGAALPALGEAAFAGVAPYFSAPATVAGTTIPGATIGNAITSGFAGHGLTHVGPDAVEFAKNPSWINAGSLAMDALEIAPIVGSAYRGGIEGYNATKNLIGKTFSKATPKQLPGSPNAVSSADDVVKAGFDGNFLTRPLTLFTKNELTQGNQLYRKIGNTKGLQDLINKGGAQAPKPMKMNSGQTLDAPFFGVGKTPNENYGGIFAVETNLPTKSKYNWSSQVGGTSNYGVAPIDPATGKVIKNIPLEDLEVFRKKWFSNSYRKLDKQNLQKELKSANLQELSEKLYKWGIRGYIADQILNDGDLTGGKAVKIIEKYFEDGAKQYQKGGEYKVQSGDTFYGIANKNNISNEELQKLNPNIDINKLNIDQTIILPSVADSSKNESWFGVESTSAKPVMLGKKASSSKPILPGKKASFIKQTGLTPELLLKQAYKESTFNPKAESPAGYKGLTQIGDGVIADYNRVYKDRVIDPFNMRDAVDVQEYSMNDLYNASFINKPNENQSDQVRLAKTLAAYNWGRGELKDYLEEHKKAGVDIYSSLDWTEDLPEETKDYINKILLNSDPDFEEEYKQAIENENNKKYLELYGLKKGGEIDTFAMYKNYVNGDYDGTKQEKKASKIYDKLNRVYYRDAKAKKMSSPNYILTHIIT